jgi:hypothetical protein
LLIVTFKVIGKLGGGSGFPRVGIDCTALPCVSTDFLAANRPPDKLFNSYALGGYYLYHLGPETKVFIDGRLDVYDPKVYLDTLAVEENRLPIEELEKRYQLTTWAPSIEDAIGDTEHLASRLASRADYALVHFDDQVAVFVKRSSTTERYISQHEFRTLNPWKLDQLAAIAQSPRAQEAFREVDRALAQSDESANAKSLAALVAFRAGDPITAQQLLGEAFARDEHCKLARQVGAIITPHGSR